jgi:hypothetical protein
MTAYEGAVLHTDRFRSASASLVIDECFAGKSTDFGSAWRNVPFGASVAIDPGPINGPCERRIDRSLKSNACQARTGAKQWR